ncbi:lysylphosphatidylglycerol synthase transmembrane domain-containing protein [Bacteroidota bacterium]
MNETGKRIIRFSISAILIIASVWYATRDIDFNELWRIILNANYLWVIMSIPVILLSHWVRAMRWKTMLDPALKVKSASTWNLFSAVMIGYAFNCVLPRGGEFVRPYVYSRRERVSFTSTFATIVVERVIDVITLVVIFALVFFFLSDQIITAFTEIDVNKIILLVALFLFVGIVCFYPPVFRYLIKLFIKPVSNKFYEKISQLFEKFLKGFAIIKSPSRYIRLGAESFLIWFLYTVPMFIMFFSFDFQNVFHLGFDDAILLIIISGIGVTIAPTPGAIGVYHVLISNAMVRFYSISPEEALAYATLTHAINYLIQVTVGGLFFMRENIKKIPLQKEDITEDMNNNLK